MPTIFVSHSTRAPAKEKAIEFRALLLEGSADLKVFLSSDWNSIVAGTNSLLEIERALATHTHFVALLVDESDAGVPWICYEVGYARGRGLLPKVFAFSGVNPSKVSLPLGGIHLISTGDTNRWTEEFLAMGVSDMKQKEKKFARLFGQEQPV
jgi:hypothetical protein